MTTQPLTVDLDELDKKFGQLIGRHHREMMRSRDNCVACHQFTPTFKEIRDALPALIAAARERRRSVGADALHRAVCLSGWVGRGQMDTWHRGPEGEWPCQDIAARLLSEKEEPSTTEEEQGG